MRSPGLESRRDRSGLTLVELMIAMSLTGVLLVVLTMVGDTTSNAFRVGMSLANIEGAGMRAMGILEDRIRSSNGDNFAPLTAAPDSESVVDFRQADDFVGDNIVWSDLARVALRYSPGEVDDGLDNNANGLIDECQVVLTESFGLADARQIVLCSNVPELMPGETLNLLDDNGNGLEDEPGFAVSAEGGRVTIRLAVVGIDDHGHLTERVFERTTTFRIGD